MKITSLDKTIGETLALGYYRIPRFQRPFSWEKDQVEEFWVDTIAESQLDYFIGSIVVYEENKNKKWLGVVDGQQRLTTITLILCALRDAFKKEGLDDQAEGIHALIERKNIDNKPEYVLQPETSYPYFQEHIQKFDQPDIEVDAGSEETLLKNAFDILTSSITDVITSIKKDPTIRNDFKVEKVKDKLIHIRDKILGLKVIHITLDNEDDAYIIFETLNTRGRDLTIADLLKSHLLKLMKPKNANVDVHKKKWNDILKYVESADVKLDEFLYHHWLSKYERYVPAKKLFKSIKREIKAANAKSYFEELLLDSKLYNSIVKPTPHNWSKNELKIRNSLLALQVFRVKQQIPMVLAVLRDYKAKTLKYKHVVGILEAIEHFHFVFSAITSQRSSGGISNMYATHAIELSKAKSADKKLETLEKLKGELKRRLPSYAEFEANFMEVVYTDDQTKQKRLVQYLMAKIDAQNSNGIPVDYEQMTFEHVSSQKPKDGSNPSEYVGTIGNLLLVNSKLNQKLSNRPFQKKKEILARSKVTLDEIIANSDQWGDDEIQARSKFLAKKAYEEIWRLDKNLTDVGKLLQVTSKQQLEKDVPEYSETIMVPKQETLISNEGSIPEINAKYFSIENPCKFLDYKSPKNKVERFAVIARFREIKAGAVSSMRDDFEAICKACGINFERDKFSDDMKHGREAGLFSHTGNMVNGFPLSAFGQKYVDLLPDRDAIKALMKSKK